VCVCVCVSVLLCQCATVSACYCVSVLLCQRAPVSVCYCVSVLLCQRAPVSVCYCVSVLLCQCATVSACYCVSVLLCQRATVSVCYCVSVLLCQPAPVLSLCRWHLKSNQPWCQVRTRGLGTHTRGSLQLTTLRSGQKSWEVQRTQLWFWHTRLPISSAVKGGGHVRDRRMMRHFSVRMGLAVEEGARCANKLNSGCAQSDEQQLCAIRINSGCAHAVCREANSGHQLRHLPLKLELMRNEHRQCF